VQENHIHGGGAGRLPAQFSLIHCTTPSALDAYGQLFDKKEGKYERGGRGIGEREKGKWD